MTEVQNNDPIVEGNLTAEEYEATYTQGKPCSRYPEGFIEGLVRGLDAREEHLGEPNG